MKHLDTGSDKIKKICDAIRHETLEPAKQQARVLIEQASDQAAMIIQDARKQAEALLDAAKKQHEKEKHIFEASMVHSAKMFREKLRLEIETHFLSKSLDSISSDIFRSHEMAAKVVSALVSGFSNKSLSGDLCLILGQGLNKAEFVKHLSADVKSRMSSVENSSALDGVVLKSIDDNLRIEIRQDQLTEALLDTLRSDFRKYFYQGT
jgi:V/A-type H+/Na+-transporting ATPase subunit E